ncbi:MAG: fumarate hydratase [Kiritimatiellae bacterium]|nr:fumarate hydratase [Kiritimatiellia bacterium]
MTLHEKLLELIANTASHLPADATAALEEAASREEAGSAAEMILRTLLANAALAAASRTPMCQDTGTLTFFVPHALRGAVTPEAIAAAVREATAKGLLRRNTIDSATGRSYDDNTAPGAPVIHYTDSSTRTIRLLMKGGGSENMSTQFSLPDATIAAGRDLEGVRRAILHAVHRAQGYGCAPGILGVCIGGDRATGYECAKLQLLRDLADRNPDAALAALEERTLAEANTLGIGPMGLGGRTSLLGVKIAARPRVPASFFVTCAYLCWAARRGSIEI